MQPTFVIVACAGETDDHLRDDLGGPVWAVLETKLSTCAAKNGSHRLNCFGVQCAP